MIHQLSAVIAIKREKLGGAVWRAAPGLDIAISRGRLETDSQDRYARQTTPFLWKVQR
jgi:hypothetical protein